MSRTVKIVNIVALAVWIALISLALYREQTGRPLEKQQAIKGFLGKAAYWYDIYLGTKKLGYAKQTFEWVGDEVIIKYDQEANVVQGGRERKLIESYRCVSDSSYAAKSFEYSSHFVDEKGVKVTGEVDSDEVVFFLESAERRKTFRKATRNRTIYLPATIIPAIVRQNPSPPAVFTVPMLDMVNLSVNDVKVSVEEVRPVKLGTEVISSYKLRIGKDILWSNDKGITVKQESSSGVKLYFQTEVMAIDPKDGVLFDALATPFLKAGKVLRDTENLNSLKVKIKGYSLDPATYENSRTVTLKNSLLSIRRVDPAKIAEKKYRLPSSDEAVSRYLRADEWVLSDNKTVKGNALAMATIEDSDAYRFARYLNSNIFLTVKTMLLFVLPSSTDIFKTHSGDYIERAVIFASFARAAGLPTRLVGGMVYRDGYFYFHTWPEVWFDGWIPVDPTLAQFPADVTHIPLREGGLKDIISLVEELRTVDIEILEAS